MARGENCVPSERATSRTKARGILLGSYRPDSRARREQTAELIAEQEARRQAEEDERRAAEELAAQVDAWQEEAERVGNLFFDTAEPRYGEFRDAWAASGLDAAVGMGWVQVYQSSPYDKKGLVSDIKGAVRNHKAGLTSDFAAPFIKVRKRVSTKQMLGYQKLIEEGKLPDAKAAAGWMRLRLGVEETREWLKFTDDPSVAFNWQQSGFGREQAVRWFEASKDNASAAFEANDMGWEPERLAGWTERVPVEYLARQLRAINQTDLRPEDLDAWQAQGYLPADDPANGRNPASLQAVVRLARMGLTPEQGGAILDRRQQEDQQFRIVPTTNTRSSWSYREHHFLPASQKLDWQSTGLGLAQCTAYFEAGLRPDEALRWNQRGVDPQTASVYTELGLNPDDELPRRTGAVS